MMNIIFLLYHERNKCILLMMMMMMLLMMMMIMMMMLDIKLRVGVILATAQLFIFNYLCHFFNSIAPYYSCMYILDIYFDV